MKIVTLVENTTFRETLICEHGLSLYIETGSHRILFDAGQSNAFADNAQKLGIDLGSVDLAVLSHGHYDHGGGWERFLEINQTAPIYLRQNAFTSCYNSAGKYIGLDPALRKSDRLVLVEDGLELADGITLYSGNKVPAEHPVNSHGQQILKDGKLTPDDYSHEQYLLIQEGERRFCFSGCSHRGIENIVRHFQPHVLVGGFHFMKLNPEGEDAAVLDRAAQALLSGDTIYYTGHCTGQRQYSYLKQRMGEQLHGLSTGLCIEL